MRVWLRSSQRRLAVVVLAALLVAACTGGGEVDDDASEPPPDGTDDPSDELLAERCPEGTDATAVWVHDQEPSDLLVDPVDLRAVAGWIQHGVHEGLYRRGTDGQLAPQLVVGDPDEERDGDGRMRLTFELRDHLTFSDGTAITGTHVEETYELLVAAGGEGARRLADPGDYRAIDPDSWEVDDRTFAFTLDRDDIRWRTWFPRVLPTHVLPDVTTAEGALRHLSLDGAPVPTSGPMVVAAWDRGERIRFERNDRYHGPHPDRDDVRNREPACVAGLELRFAAGTDQTVAALRGGDADLALLPPQEDLLALGERTTRVTVAPDPATEVLLLNLADPHLRDARVREALAAAIHREELVEQLHAPLLGDDVPASGHGSVLFGPAAGFDPAQEAGLGVGDTDRMDALLLEAGYEREGDGTYAHPERSTLTLRLSTTGDDPLRERQQQLLQTRLVALGWDVQIDNLDGQAHLDEQLLAPSALACARGVIDGDEVSVANEGIVAADCDRFDVAQISLHPPTLPVAGAERFRTDGGRDPTGLRSDAFDIVLDGCVGEGDPDQRRACAERLDRTLVTRDVDNEGLVLIPLAVRPHLHLEGPTVVRRPLASPAPEAGPLVDIADLVVGPDEPSAS